MCNGLGDKNVLKLHMKNKKKQNIESSVYVDLIYLEFVLDCAVYTFCSNK